MVLTNWIIIVYLLDWAAPRAWETNCYHCQPHISPSQRPSPDKEPCFFTRTLPTRRACSSCWLPRSVLLSVQVTPHPGTPFSSKEPNLLNLGSWPEAEWLAKSPTPGLRFNCSVLGSCQQQNFQCVGGNQHGSWAVVRGGHQPGKQVWVAEGDTRQRGMPSLVFAAHSAGLWAHSRLYKIWKILQARAGFGPWTIVYWPLL